MVARSFTRRVQPLTCLMPLKAMLKGTRVDEDVEKLEFLYIKKLKLELSSDALLGSSSKRTALRIWKDISTLCPLQHCSQ